MKTNRLLKSGAVALALFGLLVAPACAQEVTATFTNTFGDGIWQRDEHIGVIGNPNDPSIPGNWDTGAYPDNFRKLQDPNTGFYIPDDSPLYDVVIAIPTPCTLGSNVGVEIQTLNVANLSTLNIAGGSLIAIANGTLTNNGLVTISDGTGASTAQLRFDANCNIDGTGSILLKGFGNTYNIADLNLSNVTVTHGANHLIHGLGTVVGFNSATLINNGTINADDPGGGSIQLDLSNNINQNNGTIEATNGGLLTFNSGTMDQTGGGTFLADGANSRITLGIGGPSAVFTIIGGIVTTANGGVVQGVYGTLTSCTNNGDFQIPGNDITVVTGTGLTNNGTVTINDGTGATTAQIRFDASGTLDGTGSLLLKGFGNTFNIADLNLSNVTVTNGANHLIHGLGTVVGFNSATLINNGTIDADDAGGGSMQLDLSNNTNQNNGTIEATNGGLLEFNSGTIDQTGGGTFLADGANSLITLGIGGPADVFTIIGGIVTTANGGVVQGVYGTLTSCTNNGDFQIPGNDTTVITGTGLTNNGTVTINDGTGATTAQIRFDASGALDGTGSLLLKGFGNTFNIADLNLSNVTVTNGANHLIHGLGTVVGFNSATLINNGTINGDDVGGGSMQLDLSNNTNQNNGTIEATNGGLLGLYSGTVDQTGGGTILATGNGSTVVLGGSNYAHITGGSLNGTAGGVVSSAAGILDGNITNSGAYEIPANGITLLYATTLTNNGTMTVDDDTSLFRFDLGNTTLGGTGAIVLTNAATMIVNNGQTLTNGETHVLTGNGTINIGSGSLLTNNGTLAPGTGNSPGQLNIVSAGYNGALTLSFPSQLSFKIGGTTAVTQYDVLNNADINNGTDLSGMKLNGKLVLNLINGFTPLATDTFTIVITPSVLGGNFTNVKSGGRMNTEDGGGSFQVDYHVINNVPLSQNVTLSSFGPVLPPSQGLNISTRADVGTGEDVAIADFIITGTDPKKVIIRGIGPSLTAYGVQAPLADPTLQLNDSSHTIATNNDWKDTQQTDIQNSGRAPSNDLESAIITTLAPGAYTAILSGNTGGTGIGLVEVYDLDQAANSRLANISTRGFVGTGDNVLIGGTVVGPSNGNSSPVLVRAIGPSLASLGVINPLQDPTLELHDANGVLFAFNDNWKDVQQEEIEATAHTPSDDNESAIFLALAPGGWTAIVRGKNGATGVALVEVFNVQ
jgi:hypothetical protein